MMLTSTLRSLAAGTAVLALTALGISTLVPNESTPYAPRPEAPAAQPDGAMEIRRMLVGDADGNIDHAGLQALRREVVKAAAKQSSAKSNTLSWHELGPDNIGGRTRALAAVGVNKLYAGAVSGGLWKSVKTQDHEVGDVWTQVLSFPSLMVGSIAVAGDGTMYVGTGSNFDGAGGEGGSGFRGDGIWMSTDVGASWTLVEGTSGYDATDAMVADPTNENRIWYASMDGYGSITDGVLSEVPGGADSPSNATDVAIAPDGSYCLVAGANGVPLGGRRFLQFGSHHSGIWPEREPASERHRTSSRRHRPNVNRRIVQRLRDVRHLGRPVLRPVLQRRCWGGRHLERSLARRNPNCYAASTGSRHLRLGARHFQERSDLGVRRRH